MAGVVVVAVVGAAEHNTGCRKELVALLPVLDQPPRLLTEERHRFPPADKMAESTSCRADDCVQEHSVSCCCSRVRRGGGGRLLFLVCPFSAAKNVDGVQPKDGVNTHVTLHLHLHGGGMVQQAPRKKARAKY